jgi:hypothetical protein
MRSNAAKDVAVLSSSVYGEGAGTSEIMGRTGKS